MVVDALFFLASDFHHDSKVIVVEGFEFFFADCSATTLRRWDAGNVFKRQLAVIQIASSNDLAVIVAEGFDHFIELVTRGVNDQLVNSITNQLGFGTVGGLQVVENIIGIRHRQSSNDAFLFLGAANFFASFIHNLAALEVELVGNGFHGDCSRVMASGQRLKGSTT